MKQNIEKHRNFCLGPKKIYPSKSNVVIYERNKILITYMKNNREIP